MKTEPKTIILLSTAVALLALIYVTNAIAESGRAPDLTEMRWNHGAENCDSSQEPPIQVVQTDQSTYVMRQSKCVHFEAPFMFLLLGEQRALLLDTGATKEADQFPLSKTVMTLIDEYNAKTASNVNKLLVMHSHSHLDHQAADGQFAGNPGVELVRPNEQGVKSYFGFDDWPNTTRTIDLGNRSITIIPTPGHQEEAVTLHDQRTNWLLTGDTLYPGNIRIKNWQDYRDSIQRLHRFTRSNKVTLLLGAHIEMSNKVGEVYPVGSTYQPDELPLALILTDLEQLNTALSGSPKARKLTFDNFTISPLSRFEKLMGSILKRVSGR